MKNDRNSEKSHGEAIRLGRHHHLPEFKQQLKQKRFPFLESWASFGLVVFSFLAFGVKHLI
jgi:hypothetical protein